MIILNTAESAKELMERRGANYSDRPPMVLHGELYVKINLDILNTTSLTKLFLFSYRLAWGKMVAQLSNNEGFRLQRKFVHQCLNAQAVASLNSLHTQETHTLVKNILDSPQDFRKHIERFVKRFSFFYWECITQLLMI